MIRIVTDSTCEAPDEVMSHPAVRVVPLSVVFGQEALRDGVDITRDQFWERLPSAHPLPTTSQANPGDFLDPFQQLTDSGDEVIALPLSRKLSGTYESAVQAQQRLPGRPIDVVDSLSVSVGLGLMLQQAVRMIEAGASRQEIVAALHEMRGRIRILIALDTLEYLQKGGRIGKAQALVGTLLKFKPLLGIQDGEVIPISRVRTRRKALENMVEILARDVQARGRSVHIGVTHGVAGAEARQTAMALQECFQTSSTFVCALGPVLGVHVGPGTVGAAVLVTN